ncbi:hypothetical protein AVEN_180370-1 [Araneus ventricosus]|uniref:Uncharacterized protein n=1 Tax=Araneus ventricosus TaxID=182803 RepID=A0A4Y2QQZ3_ARAVE|nr:hypothetical protein AVEN_180370-1 [Araneus ventricosus]
MGTSDRLVCHALQERVQGLPEATVSLLRDLEYPLTLWKHGVERSLTEDPLFSNLAPRSSDLDPRSLKTNRNLERRNFADKGWHKDDVHHISNNIDRQ